MNHKSLAPGQFFLAMGNHLELRSRDLVAPSRPAHFLDVQTYTSPHIKTRVNGIWADGTKYFYKHPKFELRDELNQRYFWIVSFTTYTPESVCVCVCVKGVRVYCMVSSRVRLFL